MGVKKRNAGASVPLVTYIFRPLALHSTWVKVGISKSLFSSLIYEVVLLKIGVIPINTISSIFSS
jgi:hypothetical protein